jgi:hypothetical protein
MSFEIVLDGGLEMRLMILVKIWLDLGTEMSDLMHRWLYEDEGLFYGVRFDKIHLNN